MLIRLSNYFYKRPRAFKVLEFAIYCLFIVNIWLAIKINFVVSGDYNLVSLNIINEFIHEILILPKTSFMASCFILISLVLIDLRVRFSSGKINKNYGRLVNGIFNIKVRRLPSGEIDNNTTADKPSSANGIADIFIVYHFIANLLMVILSKIFPSEHSIYILKGEIVFYFFIWLYLYAVAFLFVVKMRALTRY